MRKPLCYRVVNDTGSDLGELEPVYAGDDVGEGEKLLFFYEDPPYEPEDPCNETFMRLISNA